MVSAAMEFAKRYGRPGGAPMVYLHGTPGAPLEAELMSDAAAVNGVELWALDRARVAPTTRGAEYLDSLAGVIRQLGAGQRLPMLGFSIGAAFALRIAARLEADAGPLFLFSAAGPLDLPGAFDGMGAGAHIFRTAQVGGPSFALAVRAQAMIARHAPAMMGRLLFSAADEDDRAFARTPAGRALLARVFTSAWAEDGRGYRRDLATYVEDWSAELRGVTSPVEMWHGAGDTWAPLRMAQEIQRLLPAARLHVGKAGHYTTLLEHAGLAFEAASRARPSPASGEGPIAAASQKRKPGARPGSPYFAGA